MREYRGVLPAWKDFLLTELILAGRLRWRTIHGPLCIEAFVSLAEFFWGYGLRDASSITRHGYRTIVDVFRKLIEFVQSSPEVRHWNGFPTMMEKFEEFAKKTEHITGEDWTNRFRVLQTQQF